jgi:hypothetical protein
LKRHLAGLPNAKLGSRHPAGHTCASRVRNGRPRPSVQSIPAVPCPSIARYDRRRRAGVELGFGNPDRTAAGVAKVAHPGNWKPVAVAGFVVACSCTSTLMYELIAWRVF